MKASGAMMVSRNNEQTTRSIQSLIDSNVDNIVLWVDPTKTSIPEIREITPQSQTPVRLSHQVQYTADPKRHHDNVTATYHEMIKTAKHPAVAVCDDDDLFMQNVKQYTPLLEQDPNIGVIYGHKRELARNRRRLVRSKPVTQPSHARQIKGSCQIYNREAFKHVSPHVDINLPPVFKKRIWFGYYYDWQVFYWMIQLGYGMHFVDEMFCTQNVNQKPDPERRKMRGKWRGICTWYSHRVDSIMEEVRKDAL